MKELTLIIGGAGQLGTALRATIGSPFVAPSRTELDILTDDLSATLDQFQPSVVINCAAFHNVDQCERDVRSALAVNSIAVDRLAEECASRSITFVTISTDYVFSGDDVQPYGEDDATGPRTAYGVSKVAGELLTRRRGPRHIIVRTSGVFGTTGTSSKGYTLIDKVLAQAERGEVTRMVADMTFSPSFAPHVATAIHALIASDAFGTHHVTNRGNCTWYEFVRTAFEKAGLSNARLESINYADLRNATRRPMHSPLRNTSFERYGITPLPSWQEAIEEFLLARGARVASAS